MGRLFIDALHRKRVQKKFIQQQQHKKHKAKQMAPHKPRAIIMLAKRKSGSKSAKLYKNIKTLSQKKTSSKQLHFKSNTKNSAKLSRGTSKYNKGRLDKKVKRSTTKTKKITSLPLPRSLSTYRHHHLSPSFLTSRAKIKAAAKRAKLQRRLSANNVRSRLATGSHKQKKGNTPSRANKNAPANRHCFIRFFHAMMSTGKIPNKPPSARSSEIKKLWKLVHHRKTHDERVRLGEDILNGKFTPAEVATLASSASKRSSNQSKKMKIKASDFKFTIVPANKNKITK